MLSIGKLQFHCSYINRAIVSQALRGFVSDSWPFLLSPPSEQSELRRCCFRSMSVCLSVRSAPVNQTSLKRLKLLRTSNLACMFPGTVRT